MNGRDAMMKICPPCPSAINRAARFIDGPNQSPSRYSASPACTAIRQRNTTARDVNISGSTRCTSTAAPIASFGDSKRAMKPSPVCLTMIPPRAAVTSRTSSSCSRNALLIAAVSVDHSAVEPSMSENKNTETAPTR
jgi:hypothetical protein